MKIVEELAQIIANIIIPIRDELDLTKRTLDAVKEYTGFVDTDGDGVPDDIDADPNDPNVGANTPYYTYVDAESPGYFWPVYQNSSGLVSPELYNINGQTFYFDNNVMTTGVEYEDWGMNTQTLPSDIQYSVSPNSDAVVDTDNDGVLDPFDAFKDDPTQTTDSDGDGYGDNPSGNNPDAFPNDPTQTTDSDGDGYGDNPLGNNPDAFPNDATQTTDSDGDGYGDNQSGNNPDAFPDDPTQTTDSDGDGYGDNPLGNNPDAFPNDATQTTDSDGDGFGDNPLGNNPDAFPNDPTQTTDSDGDGYGDNLSGNNPDAFPNDPTQNTDSDGDGYGDNQSGNNPDAFPNDATQTTDSDGDGYGDNPLGNNPDAFPNDATQNTDSDGDGYGDNPSGNNPDAFPNDPTQNTDSDGDGYGDNPSGNNPDAFPNDPLESADSDGDGVGDRADAYPDDPLLSFPPSNWDASSSGTQLWYDPSDATTLTLSGTEITQVQDKSGNGYHLSVDVGQVGPSHVESLNNLSTFGFNNHNLENTSFNWDQENNPIFMAFIAKFDPEQNSVQAYPWSGSKNSSGRLTMRKRGTGLFEFFGKRDGNFKFLYFGSVENTGWQLYVAKINGVNSYSRVNGAEAYASDLGDYNIEAFILGHNENDQQPFDGSFAEILMFTNENDITKVEGYLAHKWGITESLVDGHPYKETSPVGEPLDTDADTILDANDYFYLDSTLTHTYEELDAYPVISGDVSMTEPGAVFKYLGAPWAGYETNQFYIVEEKLISYDGVFPNVNYRMRARNGSIMPETLLGMANGPSSPTTDQRNWEIRGVPIDSDSDGVRDDHDYFFGGANDDSVNNYWDHTGLRPETEEELNAWVLDPLGTIGVGSVIKITSPNRPDQYVGEYLLIRQSRTAGTNTLLWDTIDKYGDTNTRYVGQDERGTNYEVVVPDGQQTTIPDSDSDGVADDTDYFINNPSYTQTLATLQNDYFDDTYYSHSNLSVGSIVKVTANNYWVLADGSGNDTSVSVGEYLIYQGYDYGVAKYKFERGDGSYTYVFNNVLYYGPNAVYENLVRVDLQENLSPQPDQDGDGTPDSEDYFRYNSNYTYTLEQLESFTRHGYNNSLGRPEEVGDIVVRTGPHSNYFSWYYSTSGGEYAIIREISGPFSATDYNGNPITYKKIKVTTGRNGHLNNNEFYMWGDGRGGIGTALLGSSNSQANPVVDTGLTTFATIGRP